MEVKVKELTIAELVRCTALLELEPNTVIDVEDCNGMLIGEANFTLTITNAIYEKRLTIRTHDTLNDIWESHHA